MRRRVAAASWSSKGVILFSPTPNSGMWQIADAGGKPTPVTIARTDTEQSIGYNWPQFLPDGRHFLYLERAANPDYQGVYVGELGTASRSPRVLAIDGMAVYGLGYLAFVRDGVLFSQPFDVRTFRASGDTIRIADHVGYFSTQRLRRHCRVVERRVGLWPLLGHDHEPTVVHTRWSVVGTTRRARRVQLAAPFVR